MNHDRSKHHDEPRKFWRSRYALCLMVLGSFALYFLLTEHRAHFFGALPFLLLMACPLMHIFMHHGHGGHGKDHANRDQNLQSVANSKPVDSSPHTDERP